MSASPLKSTVGTTTGKARYVKRPASAEELYVYLDGPRDGPGSNLQHVEVDVQIADLRQRQSAPTLDRNGFQLETLHVDVDIEWDNDAEVKAKYYPLVDKLLRQATGATSAHIFNHTIRRGRIRTQQGSPGEQEVQGVPLPRVHADFTFKSGVERLHTLLPDKAAELQRTPFAIMQVWRPLEGPLHDSPLALLDVESVSKSDYRPYAVHFPERTVYNFAILADNYKDHRWYYAKGMTAQEAYVFKSYDSRKGRACFCPHTGFIDSATPEGAPARESIEIRAYCFWQDAPEASYAQGF